MESLGFHLMYCSVTKASKDSLFGAPSGESQHTEPLEIISAEQKSSSPTDCVTWQVLKAQHIKEGVP